MAKVIYARRQTTTSLESLISSLTTCSQLDAEDSRDVRYDRDATKPGGRTIGIWCAWLPIIQRRRLRNILPCD